MTRDTHSKSTDLWLLPEDEAQLGQHIGAVLPEAAWRCSQPGPKGLHQVHLHPSIESALNCGGTQTFVDLPAGATLPVDIVRTEGVPPATGPASAAVMQLLRSRLIEDEHDPHFRSGRLAVRWRESETGPDIHRALAEQTRLIWSALRTATHPAHVQDANSRGITGMRIGQAALETVARHNILLGRPGAHRFHLVSTSKH